MLGRVFWKWLASLLSLKLMSSKPIEVKCSDISERKKKRRYPDTCIFKHWNTSPFLDTSENLIKKPGHLHIFENVNIVNIGQPTSEQMVIWVCSGLTGTISTISENITKSVIYCFNNSES